MPFDHFWLHLPSLAPTCWVNQSASEEEAPQTSQLTSQHSAPTNEVHKPVGSQPTVARRRPGTRFAQNQTRSGHLPQRASYPTPATRRQKAHFTPQQTSSGLSTTSRGTPSGTRQPVQIAPSAPPDIQQCPDYPPRNHPTEPTLRPTDGIRKARHHTSHSSPTAHSASSADAAHPSTASRVRAVRAKVAQRAIARTIAGNRQQHALPRAVRLHNGGRNTAAITDLVPVLPSPRPDFSGVRLHGSS